MLYNKKSTKYVGTHKHTRGTSLAQEADMVSNNILHSSGFFNGPGTGLNPGHGSSVNQSMENFIGKWNNMNQSRNTKPYASGSKTHKFKGL